MSDIPDNAPAPRLCIITKWPDFEGYGFNLHAEKSKPGQYIGKVDAASPAELAGLLEGDRIVEVNGVNIANENHKQVVQRIKAVSNETRLLVLDPEADKYYKAKNIVVRGGQSNVVTKSSVRAPPSPATPEPPATNGHHQDDADARSVSSAASSSAASEASTQPQSPMSTSPTPPPSLDNTSSNTAKSTPTPTPDPTPTPTKATTTTTSSSSSSPASTPAPTPAPSVASNNAYNSSGLNLNMSAAEMRAMLARKKKADPRKDTLDLRKKYEIIQNM